MAQLKVAAQLYTVREFLKTPEDIAKSLKKIKEIGYRAIQVSGMGPIDHQELKHLADAEGLTICATHIPYNRLKDELDSVIEQHKLWNCTHVGLGSMPKEYLTDAQSVKTFAREASEIGKKLAEHGLRFMYHNHNFEFVKLDGKTVMDILLTESDPEAFDFEIDTYWVQLGGANPVDWIHKVAGRMKVVHFKDMAVDPDRKPIMAEVGEGNFNWQAIIDACKETGVEWCAVEQDICSRDPFESLAISLNNLKQFGLN